MTKLRLSIKMFYKDDEGRDLISSAQIRAARAMLKWSAGDLASRSRLARTTIVRAEFGEGTPPITQANLHAIQTTLESAGVTFTADGYVGLIPNRLD